MNENTRFGTGVIEGFYGLPWSQAARLEYCRWLPQAGYDFYIYAPKGDEVLRKQWRGHWDSRTLQNLQEQRQLARESGLGFGIGFSPFEIYKDYNPDTREALLDKVRYIEEELTPDIFCALFDDMHGEQAALARLQADIVADIASVTTADRIVLCPTYYSLDPVLERLFGPRPEKYFELLGDLIDPAVDIFWTGEHICSESFPVPHLEEMTKLLKRKPLLWDNYPVNDVREMCNFLNIGPFTNRPPVLKEYVAGHVVNPMKQPWLSKAPLASLPLSYQRGSDYDPDSVLLETLTGCYGKELGRMLAADHDAFQKRGLQHLVEEEKQGLRQRYTPFAGQEVVAEVLAWLDGEYVFDDTIFAA